jgi:hypothetical protein
MSAETLFTHLDTLDATHMDAYFGDIEKNPFKSVLLYYLNSGYGRFQQYKEFDKAWDGKNVATNEICKEIDDEILDETELYKLLETFFHEHSYTDVKLLSCGACGLREMEPEMKEGNMKNYKNVALSNLSLLLYDDDANEKLQSLKSKGGVLITQEEGGAKVVINPYEVISLYTSKVDPSNTYHLHPELVRQDKNGNEITMLCSSCYKKIIKQEKIPQLSIANGVDFGYFKRIPELTEPNLHEQLVLSQFRLFQVILKVVPNFKYQQNYTRFDIKANAILFLQDAPKQVHDMIKNSEYLASLFKIYMLDEKGNEDRMSKKFFGTTTLLARSHIVTQWFMLLDKTNQWFDYGYAKIIEIVEAVAKSVETIQADTRFIQEEEDLKRELMLGSDVAMVQQVDATNAEIHTAVEQTKEDHDTREVPLKYTFVTPIQGLALETDDVQTSVILNAAEEVFFGKDPSPPDVSTVLENDDEENNENFCRFSANNPEISDHDNDCENDLGSMGVAAVTQPRETNICSSYRNSIPQSEFDSTDKLLGATFPHVFLLGKAYKRSVGSLSVTQRNHLLKQFTNVPASNRRLLGYLQDAKKRHQVLQGVKGQIYGNAKAVRKVMDMLNDGKTKQLFVNAKENPGSPMAKNLIKELLPLLNVSGRDVSYGAVEGRMSLSRSLEMCKRYGPGSVFLTLAFDDIHNTRAIRASYSTVNNDTFPAVYEKGGIHGDNGKQYMQKLREASTLSGQGTILLDGTEVEKSHTRSALATRAIDNPVAYVNESKSMINDVLSILLGVAPENFFGSLEGRSVRKVRYFKSNGKGICGFTLAFNGTVEDHTKGTLHYHLIIYGSLPPYILQRLANLEEICNSVSKALDTMFRAQLPTNIHARHMIHRILRSNNKLELKVANLDSLTVPAILDKEDPLQRIETEVGTKSTHERIYEETANHGCKNHFHCHCATCRKGLNGYKGCRLCKPSGERVGTKPVQLVPVITKNEESKDKETYDYEVQSVETLQHIQYETWNPVDCTNKQIIVWELHRPKLFLGKDIIANMEGRGEIEVRNDIIETFHGCLENDESYNDISKIWSWLDEVPFEQLVAFFQEFVDEMEEANGYVVDHVPLLLYCMGSHHNALVLGGSEQAKAAMFYISPYVSKGKVDLAACLTILEDARKDIEKYPSKAVDCEFAPRRRKAQHFLTRTLNKMNAYMEMSDYQVAADLLNLPCMICSDVFGYFNPIAYLAYQSYIYIDNEQENNFDHLTMVINENQDRLEREQVQEAEIEDDVDDFIDDSSNNTDENRDNDDSEQEDIEEKNGRTELDQEEFCHSFGAIKMYTLEKANEGEGDDIKQAIPLVANYSNRGLSLANYSRSEYDALVQIKARRSRLDTCSARIRSEQFLFSENFPPHGKYAQFLRAKPRTLIYYGKGPRHPGKKPVSEISSRQFKNWKKKADEFAKYYLVAFRPEPQCYNGNDENNLLYNWNALQNWVKELQEDRSVLSKFRLQAFYNRLHALDAEYKTKVITTMYRARNRTIWSDLQKASFNKDDILNRLQRFQHEFEEYEFENNHAELSNAVNSNLNLQIEDDSKQSATLLSLFNGKAKRSFLLTSEHSNLTFGQDELQLQLRFATILENEPLPQPSLQVNLTEEKDDTSSIDTCDMIAGSDESDDVFPWDVPIYQPCDYASELNEKQNECYQVYKSYFENLDNASSRPPPVTLLTGAAGTGKSHVILAIDSYAKELNIRIIKTAFNNMNAIDVDGPTLTKLAYLNGATSQHLDDIEPSKLKYLWQEYGYKEAKLIIVDEASNIVSHVYARLDQICKQATGNYKDFFGGIPVLLVGDFHQKGPVQNKVITTHLMALAEHNWNCEKELQSLHGTCVNVIPDIPNATSKKSSSRFIRCKMSHIASNAIHSDSKFRSGSPFRLGCEIFASSKWIELSEQQRSNDTKHTQFIVKMSKGEPIELEDVKQYKILSEEDFYKNSKWHTAPIIVRTNRERHTLNHIRCENFAKVNNTVVVRWLTKYGFWEQKPASEEHINAAMQDPVFYQYFVKSAPGYCTQTLCKAKRIANGTKIQYHSLSLTKEQKTQFELKLLNAQSGDVIELEEPPLSVNVILVSEEKNAKLISQWKDFTLIPDRVVVPILQHKNVGRDKKGIPIPGGLLYKPSKVRITPLFPLDAGFAITVDKAQGQTIERVIVALSARKGKFCNMDYEAVYVSHSRVQQTDHLRLLLSGDSVAKQMSSLTYISTLRPQKSIKAFFSGYSEDRANWKSNSWNEKKAYNVYCNR